ncbi:MAG: S8 family peptidase [Nitrosomonas sp.]|uniref:S8 family peptidase n=1 Tax=Nitrosomonas sp. TaxID=42353 RepID=UPI0025DFBD7A|nr:S8 family peptidase [Nitrosomonas sp.]MBY0475692.1 S8 family peptidase [Nitrosomonas sp.]
MTDHLPLLVFSRATTVAPSSGNGFSPSKPHFPNHTRQVERLSQQLNELQQDFSRYKASVSGTMAGLEPETVLVIEIVGSVDDFKRTVESTDGLEWLGEWDVEDIEPDDNFYETPKIGVNFFKNKIAGITNGVQSKEIQEILKKYGFIDDGGKIIAEKMPELSLPDHLAHLHADITATVNSAKDSPLRGRLFLSIGNEKGLKELLVLWQCWQKEQVLPYRKSKWRAVFEQTLVIRRWGIKETLRETGMIERWHDLLDPINPAQEIYCQIELFYRQNPEKRKQSESAITKLLAEIDGQTISSFIDMPNIAFHAVKAKLPADRIRHLLKILESPANEIDIQLFKFPGVMYFRPTGQSLTDSGNEVGEPGKFPEGSPELPPVVAILDGAPNILHDALKDRLLFDDPDNLAAEYQPGEKRHGTAMASLVVHGELLEGLSAPLTRKVYHLAIMQPNLLARSFGEYVEHFPDEVFFEDRIERAVRRMFEGEGATPAQAPDIKIINLSIGDPERPFIHTPSPWARLLDWLSWKYRVLFCVSTGNFLGDIQIDISHSEFSSLSDTQKVVRILKCMEEQLSERRLLSPAESLNSLTVGALHADESGTYMLGQRTELLPISGLFSPISRFGHGFRRSVKPEILFPGGRQLFAVPILTDNHPYSIDTSRRRPGQRVAWDSLQQGNLSESVYARGTSNATALATRGGARIYEVLAKLQEEHGEEIPDNLIAVLIKSLLVHGAQHHAQAEKALTESLKSPINSRRFKEVMARYIGYGAVDIDRVLACTEQRATVMGCGEIKENQVHEYRFPLPSSLSGSQVWRRMLVTLAWFSPINSAHRNLREAKLELQPGGSWDKLPLKIKRISSDHNQVLRGTVQHEILEGTSQISEYEEDGYILLHVACKADATEKLDQLIPYGLAVTLEVAEGVEIPIYQQIRAKIKPQVAIRAHAGGS